MIADEILKWVEHASANQRIREIEGLFVIGSDVGTTRDQNQDRVAVLKVGSAQRNKVSWCACVCDGMGGMKDGARAASVALASFLSSLISNRRMQPLERLEIAAREANAEVSTHVSGGGATLSALLLEDGEIFTINVGDSRMYSVSAEGELRRLTIDDTLEDAFGSEGRGLLQYIGTKSGLKPHVERLKGTIGRIIVTSDGAHVIGENLIARLATASASNSELCERVLEIANWVGGIDNATIVATGNLPFNQSATVETSPDISVWTVEGRLRIAWPNRPALPLVSPEETPPAVEATIANEPKQEGKKAPPPPSSKSKPRNRRQSKKKREQIEIGFSDEGQNDDNR